MSPSWQDEEKALQADFEAAQARVHAALCDNINTRAALDVLADLVRSTNVYLAARPGGEPAPQPLLLRGVAAYVTRILGAFGLATGAGDAIGLPATGGAAGNGVGEGDAAGGVRADGVLDAFSAFRDQVRALAKGGSPAGEILEACDRCVRGVHLCVCVCARARAPGAWCCACGAAWPWPCCAAPAPALGLRPPNPLGLPLGHLLARAALIPHPSSLLARCAPHATPPLARSARPGGPWRVPGGPLTRTLCPAAHLLCPPPWHAACAMAPWSTWECGWRTGPAPPAFGSRTTLLCCVLSATRVPPRPPRPPRASCAPP